MFTDDQVKQLRKVIREEIEAEAKHIRIDSAKDRLEIRVQLNNIEDRIKDQEIEVSTLRKDFKEEMKGAKEEMKGVKEEIKATKDEILEKQKEDAKAIASMFHETWERMEASNDRIAALEQHTGLIKHN